MEKLIKKLNNIYSSPEALLLLKKEWREKNINSGIPATGFCYIAAEVIFHSMGGRELFKIKCQKMKDGGCHWFLTSGQKIVDPTSSQLPDGWDYSLAKSGNFLTSAPSKRAVALAKLAGIKLNA